MVKLLVLLSVCVVCPVGLWAHGGDRRICSEGTLRGDYGLTVNGIRTIAPGTAEQFATLSMVTFDGVGAFTAVGVSAGSVTGVRRAGQVTGRYSVNANCTGTWTTNIPNVPPVTADIIIVDQGREVLVTAVSPGEISTGTARKK